MQKTISLIFGLISIISFSQNKSDKQIDEIAKKVNIENYNIFRKLVSHKEFEIGSIYVIPEITEKKEDYIILNSNIILVNNDSHEIIANYQGEADWFIDAIILDDITIQPDIYDLNNSKIAFGVQLHYYGSSGPNPYTGIELSLYELDNKKLNLILENYPINSFNGETDTNCNGDFKEHNKTIEVINKTKEKYPDLKVIDTITYSKMSDENCETKIYKTSKEIHKLKYTDGKYKNIL